MGYGRSGWQIERGRSDVNVPWRRSKADTTCMYEQYIARYSSGIFPVRILPRPLFLHLDLYKKKGH